MNLLAVRARRSSRGRARWVVAKPGVLSPDDRGRRATGCSGFAEGRARTRPRGFDPARGRGAVPVTAPARCHRGGAGAAGRDLRSGSRGCRRRAKTNAGAPGPKARLAAAGRAGGWCSTSGRAARRTRPRHSYAPGDRDRFYPAPLGGARPALARPGQGRRGDGRGDQQPHRADRDRAARERAPAANPAGHGSSEVWVWRRRSRSARARDPKGAVRPGAARRQQTSCLAWDHRTRPPLAPEVTANGGFDDAGDPRRFERIAWIPGPRSRGSLSHPPYPSCGPRFAHQFAEAWRVYAGLCRKPRPNDADSCCP